VLQIQTILIRIRFRLRNTASHQAAHLDDFLNQALVRPKKSKILVRTLSFSSDHNEIDNQAQFNCC
jgi:hypothetical protein